MATSKGKIIDAIYRELAPTSDYLPKDNVSRVINLFVDKIRESLIGGEQVTVSGLCSFNLVQYAARTYRNPATGEPVEVSARLLPRAKFSASLVDEIIAANPVG